jgi:hypothetical protein
MAGSQRLDEFFQDFGIVGTIQFHDAAGLEQVTPIAVGFAAITNGVGGCLAMVTEFNMLSIDKPPLLPYNMAIKYGLTIFKEG